VGWFVEVCVKMTDWGRHIINNEEHSVLVTADPSDIIIHVNLDIIVGFGLDGNWLQIVQ